MRDIQDVKEKMNECDKQQESALHSFVQDEALPTLEKMAVLSSSIDTTFTSLHTSVTASVKFVFQLHVGYFVKRITAILEVYH